MILKFSFVVINCLAICATTGCSGLPPETKVERETNEDDGPLTAYLQQLRDINIISRFFDSNGKAIEAPVDFSRSSNLDIVQPTKQVHLAFNSNTALGHADFDVPVRCLLVEVDEHGSRYGVYGLWKQKSELEMPLPGNESSISWDGVPSEEALVRIISEAGLSAARAREIVKERNDVWFAPGLRAFLVTKMPLDESSLPTIHHFERVSND